MAVVAGDMPFTSLGYPDSGQVTVASATVAELGYPTFVELRSEGHLTRGFESYQQGVINSLGNYSKVVALGYNLDTITKLIASYSPAIRLGNYQQYQSSFARFFGVNAKQTAAHLHISKADLPGLSPKASDTAESILIALLLQEMIYESNSLISRIVVERWGNQLISSNNKNFIRSFLLIKLSSPIIYSANRNPDVTSEISDVNQVIMPNNIIL